ncbi:2-succinyl-5-enolpyruvyl-6-hydroxy-3-cyclohexene-1-carboxylic-acid synthase [Sporosarcina sp. HYO08]|uniref:2-succinyl-5-enolpyruvyl-6-hydroxy-3- cyclohexene-1-carboxylic-acid synthase n=1 Tax=Sporosarcina sp. HYO08 TaxID=1759557 RepID=UPI000799DCA4|nr:2-succinyl-5-enolpyruvyl-6-hydroxy-3-cyclohexene-1-carboxylic-acid synthase [Sporosarcina sp. HYO08]KXH86908.1 2-succinyl-5-enolpyruvyl-6-hydroxy-3-cyclohexene-1-carboxylate synthase [Sporosarcina sp. HYO08]
MGNRQTLTNYVRRMTGALLKTGVEAAVISPGSRSTPLAYAFASTQQLKTYMQVDERSAGYFALGMAKASGKPVVLLCTSGTAASNYHPAITEAYYARIPLIVITADRPHELREVGAPQAIDQIRMYGEHVKYSVDFPLPEENSAVDDFVERQLNRAIAVAMTAPLGPVHINVPFREPLLIDLEGEAPVMTFVQRMAAKDQLDEGTAAQLIEILSSTDKGMIIAGELPVHLDKKAFWQFAKALNWPVLCDPLSNFRAEVPADCAELCIDQYDALLKSASFCDRVNPDVVIRFGAQPVSKPLSLYLKNIRPQVYVAVDESPEFRDSIGIVTHHVQSTPEAVFECCVEQPMTAYTKKWTEANKIAKMISSAHKGYIGDEGCFANQLFEGLPNGVDLVSGSSMPIRDVDTFFRKTDKDIAIFSNRGTNGIDGVISTALGIQAARKRPAWLVIGDLSFLHDVNGLLATRFHETDLTIVVMNNDGGGIFSYLPQADMPHHFEELFGTPTGLTFAQIAQMYGAQYDMVRTSEEFEGVLQREKETPLRIIEVFTDRPASVAAHRKMWSNIAERLDAHD